MSCRALQNLFIELTAAFLFTKIAKAEQKKFLSALPYPLFFVKEDFIMEVSLQMLFIVCPLVFLAGLVDSIGGGGGLISLPAYLFAGVPPHVAIATNKLSSSMGTTISAARLFRYMDLPLAGACVICSVIGSWAGSSLSLLASEKLIQYMLIPVLPVVAYYVLRQKDLNKTAQKQLSRQKTFLICMPASFFIGIYDGFYGPGTGTFLILLYTSLAKMDLLTASANTKAVNLASNVGALAVFILNGKVFFSIGLPAALFCIAGHYLGAGMVVKNGTRVVRPVILIVLAILFVKLLAGE